MNYYTYELQFIIVVVYAAILYFIFCFVFLDTIGTSAIPELRQTCFLIHLTFAAWWRHR